MSLSNLSSTLSSAISGLNAAQTSINSTAHNIVNANTEGFTRKTQSQESRIIGGQGAGVESGLVQRIADEFLISEVRNQAAITGQSIIIDTYQSRTQDAFGNPSSGQDIGSRIGELTAALEAFGSDHQTLAVAHQVVERAAEITGSIHQLDARVQALRSEANQDIERLVKSINTDLETIDKLNNMITSVHKTGDQNPDLFDKRDLVINELAEKIEIDTYFQDDGSLAVYTAEGHSLVDSTPRVLHYLTSGEITPGASLAALSIFREDQIDPTTNEPFPTAAGVELVSSGVRTHLTPELLNDAIPDADQQIVSTLGGGKLQGLIEMRDEAFPGLTDQLQELAEGLQFALNAAQNDSVSWPQPNAISGTRTDLSSFAGATRGGTATLAVIDSSDGSTLLAFEIDTGAAIDEVDLANQINTSLGAFGTATIGVDGQLDISLAAADQGLAIAEGDSSIQVTDAAGRERDYGFSHYFGLNDFLVNDGPRPTDLVVHPDLVSDPARLGSAKLDVETPPLTATLGGPGDNRGAKGLAEAIEANYAMIERGQLPARNTDLGAYAAEIVSITAAAAASAEDQARSDIALSDAVNFKANSVASVNLDEEISTLMTLQQAYSVAARLITTVDEMFDELMNAAR